MLTAQVGELGVEDTVGELTGMLRAVWTMNWWFARLKGATLSAMGQMMSPLGVPAGMTLGRGFRGTRRSVSMKKLESRSPDRQRSHQKKRPQQNIRIKTRQLRHLVTDYFRDLS